MKQKKPKPAGIPLRTLFADESFKRHFKILMRESPDQTDERLKDAILDELCSSAAANERGREKRKIGASKGGKTTAGVTSAKLRDGTTHSDLATEARRLQRNHSRRELAGILAKKHNVSTRHMRDVLKILGI